MSYKVLFAAAVGLILHGQAHAEGALQILGSMGDGSADASWGGGNGVLSYAPEKRADLQKKIVAFDRDLPPGSILVQTSERKLYYVLHGGQAEMYPIGVGREGFTGAAATSLLARLNGRTGARRQHDRPRGGAGTLYPGPYGRRPEQPTWCARTLHWRHRVPYPRNNAAVEHRARCFSGCIRMLNEHVVELYDRVQVGAKVVVE